MGLSPSLGTLRRPAFPAKSLNLPSKAKYHRDPQRGFKSNTRTPDERPKWLHEQLREYHHQHNSSGIGPGVTDTNRQINNGGDPERTASAGCHSPDDENKLSHHHQAALRRQGEVQAHKISALEREVYFTESVSRWLEDGSYLSELLQCASQHVEDLKRALSDTATQKKAADRVSPTTCPIPWQPSFPDGGVSLKVPSAGWSILPRRHHGPFLGAFVCGC
ncbi:golgin subfamily A member 6-like protein 26 isoform X4 [Saimiri boliviensis]|uniref:golgin subfamily A member 6-like protein 26 isoform X4 n=1 Tax=Saimiri boliviensis TaxID=27679 RepID=UPI003D776B47